MLHEKRIDFKQLAKPTNLQNSAVLRMLEEEEERKRAGKAGLKRVAWPPPPEDGDYIDFVEQAPVQAKTRGVGEYATYQSKSPTPQPQPQQQQQQQQEQRASCGLRQPSQFHIQPTLAKTWAPVTIAPTAGQPKAHQAASPSPSQTPPTLGTWSDKPSPGSWNSPQPGQETIIPVQIESQQQSQAPSSFVEPPASIITLRAEPPISQESAPVYLAQPAAINPTSGSMRGDQKWPPASVKEQTEAENRARIELAKGPVFRPRRANKDYSGFFAQHASTNNYPGYRAPPGTQYFTPAYQH
ncbi:MICAL-like protein 1 isoform X2 [Nasonia vitripennis]|uniref:Uncharacterized protein n=1 Tax=Nasonia vitripennis TaxID=7425 RepID=A0A7M7H694_NASVI|nr:MICAL-like protein 1 isoform X2 [Nasonia vitripennis]